MSENILHNRLCEMLDIEYPIIQASMGSAAGPGLAAAVSGAGALGTLGVTRNTPEQIRDWIKRVRDKTDKTFACGILLPAQLDENPTAEELNAKIPQEHNGLCSQADRGRGIPSPRGVLLGAGSGHGEETGRGGLRGGRAHLPLRPGCSQMGGRYVPSGRNQVPGPDRQCHPREALRRSRRRRHTSPR